MSRQTFAPGTILGCKEALGKLIDFAYSEQNSDHTRKRIIIKKVKEWDFKQLNHYGHENSIERVIELSQEQLNFSCIK
ncbi:hypothetical protein Glove_493g51 [Diversispora epigaea]|uniref:Uncharacterized protein n=1 Tax=Diversispora epigaea TaxID=1348612 RepID=A0A397GIC4_9GLOM|nr:hypothetical protein Glove_493g51 [Diversispora epigaea]